MGKLSLKIVTTDNEFNAKIRLALSKKMTKKLETTVSRILKRVRILIRGNITLNKTVRSLLEGQLKVDFGLTDQVARKAVSEIVGAIGDAVSASFFPGGASGDRAGGNYKIGTIRILVNGSQASGIVLGRTGGSYQSGGSNIDWLRWLMTAGSQVVVASHEVVSTAGYDERSRSGGGFMLKTGNDFRVDPEHAGTAGDNFITRVIRDSGPEISAIINEEMKRAF